MKAYAKTAQKPSRGVFWVIDDELLAFPFADDNPYGGVAKSGLTYNHKSLWTEIKPKNCNVPFDYYPRGRVEIKSNGAPVIYMSPHIDSRFIPMIRLKFGLRQEPEIKCDHSKHYRCYLDD